MWINARNGKVAIDDTYMDYISFGRGKKILVMIPGLGDGLKTVKGMAFPLAFMYRQFGRDYRVYIFSRKRKLPEKYTSRNMADALFRAMGQLGISKADVVGISQGGTIAQYLAIDHPKTVHKLVLTVTYAKPNDTILQVIGNWIELAKEGNYREIFIDTSERSYSEGYLRRTRWMYPLLTRISVPKSLERFLIQAKACLSHNAYEELTAVSCPTLILGGKKDRIVTAQASLEMAQVIPHAEVFLYEEYGHGVYEEARDFNRRVMEFLER